jgi:sec-independent protein translocase protein TatB
VFDIGFSEMLVCAVVALVVIGPEKLPRVARTMGHLFGRMQRYVSQVKSDIHREMEAADLGKVKTEFETAARSFQAEVESTAQETQRELGEIEKSFEGVQAAVEGAQPALTDAAASPQLELGIGEPAEKARKDSPA